MKSGISVIIFIFLVTVLWGQEKTGSNTKESGYYNYTSFGLLIGNSDDHQSTITSILSEHNYQFSPYFSAGIITGLESFDVNLLPLGLNVKLNLPQRYNDVLFAGIGAGESIALEEYDWEPQKVTDTKGGCFFMGELGYAFASKRTFNFFIAVGYRYQRFSFMREHFNQREVKRSTTYNRFSVRLGVRLY